MCKINFIDKLSFLLVLIGAVNWGTIALLDLNFVTLLTGGSELLQRLVYLLVFISALDIIYLLFKCKLITLQKYN